MARRTRLRTGIYVAHAEENGDRVWRRDPAREGRAAAMQRRRLLSQGKQALKGNGGRTAAAGASAPTLVVHRGGAG